jgi:DNA-binding NarL/FixJ family response regulator
MGVRSILASETSFKLVGEASDGKRAVDLTLQLQPDILLLDLAMPGLAGLEALRSVTSKCVKTKTIILTGSIETQQLLEALQLGARAVVLKSAVARELTACIRAVVGGQYWLNGKTVSNLVEVVSDLIGKKDEPPPKRFGLTPRELSVINLIVQGCTNHEIGDKCGISVETVKRHMKNIFGKTGVSSRLELAMFAVNKNLIAASPLAYSGESMEAGKRENRQG